ncbi:hypothetical protein FF098_001445 [Parvularcula flava]|uniref:MotA/TolQ/ExbB proton channel family protein n=1 Tax=Aquisalinus luteolus TaxID=1566827 RepID=A0A8J3EPY2_9PROT|nr:hypothetical protein [Aquisalinus luteolus]NHK26568.1 hypothetical protein [Aquisalinus luteolus]GGH92731.1 hypothetical protein GCM10011355_02920 [Aquisalinus luteolus]
MSRSLDRSVRFNGPGGYIINMVIFLAGVGAIAFYLSPLSPQPTNLLVEAFQANVALNGLILFVLGLGIIYNLRQAAVVGPAVSWVNSFRNSVDPSRTRLPRPPALIGAMSRMLLDADERGGRLSQASTRAILDSLGQRVDEGREFGRYISNLLVFLGLLGTFWGLLQVVSSVALVIGSLASAGGGGEAGDAVRQLINGLQAPLSGMGTAFSSSLFGLAGSLIIGFLDIQAGQAQNRFYTDLEDWLSGITETVTTSSGGDRASMEVGKPEDLLSGLQRIEAAVTRLANAQSEAQTKASEDVRREIRMLGRTLIEGVPAEDTPPAPNSPNKGR